MIFVSRIITMKGVEINMLKYLRINLFKRLLFPVSNFSRKKRGKLFSKIITPRENMTILDIGGQPEIWDFIKIPLRITCLNLPGIATIDHQTHHEIIYVEGDGCNMPEFHAGQFDFVFSNSVIEHVGDDKKRKQFANEVRRISKNYWIQTPYKYFPIEAHCGMPFWWLYPQVMRSFFITRWRKKLPMWTQMVEGTDVVSIEEMKALFPESNMLKEWLIFPKSLIVFSKT